MSDQVALEQRFRKLEATLEALAARERLLPQTAAFTPTLVGATTPGTFTYAAQTAASYLRLANRVWIWGQVRISAITVAPAGNMYIGALPFTAATVTYEEAGEVTFSTWQGITFPVNYYQLGGYVLSAESRVSIIRNGSGQAAARVQGAEIGLIGGLFVLRFGGSYEI